MSTSLTPELINDIKLIHTSNINLLLPVDEHDEKINDKFQKALFLAFDVPDTT